MQLIYIKIQKSCRFSGGGGEKDRHYELTKFEKKFELKKI